MIAMQLSDPGPVTTDRLTLAHIDEIAPGPDQVLIDIEACAMCRTDLQIATGDVPSHRLPLTPGHQVIGRIRAVGSAIDRARIGTRVGLAWIANACGECRFCLDGRENLCYRAAFTGWDVDGGYAQQVVAESRFAFDLAPLQDRSSQSIAPLMCAGVIGYRALRIAELGAASSGARLGLYGYGASARQVLQMARHWGVDVYVATRSDQEAQSALEAGAVWAGSYTDRPPAPLDAAITFAPVGSIVAEAVKSLDRGGIVAINAIHLDELPAMNYDDLWWERSIRSVANVTSQDVGEFIELAAQIDLKTDYELLDLEDANEGLRRIESGSVRGSFVLRPPGR
ncbi:MAG: zinc-binding alcohol dehydrogenase family protein [Actinobacteria bacterium]|nr:zinc-binding alcohol dehydrogenase family protein [Actinomycetota bacterium]